ncbi:MAG TPA: hypothetical protein VG408_01350, partial [Actinomycetota bacterium]|nr:hypothetical protein [Actinomycetota bacterium]
MGGKRSVFAVVLSMALLTGLVGQLPDAAAGKKKRTERTEEAQYVGFSGFRGALEGACDAEPLGCVI